MAKGLVRKCRDFLKRFFMATDLVSECRDFLKMCGYSLPSPETSRLDELVPPLVQVLADQNNEQLLEKAVRYLGMIGAVAEPAITPLAALIARNPITPTADEIKFKLNRSRPWSCGEATRAAMDALKRISPGRAIEEIALLCDDSDPQVRFRAALTLQTIGEPADRVIPRLVELSRDQESKIRRFAVLALWPHQTLGEETLNTLLPLTTDPDSIVRLRIDYLLAGKLSGYQRRYGDGIINIVDLLHRYPEEDMAHDILSTVPMMGSDAARFVERIMDLLRSKVPVTAPADMAIAFALREIISHYPSLTKKIRSSLRALGVPDNEAARLVLSLWEWELRIKVI